LTQPFDAADFAGLGSADGGDGGKLVVDFIELELDLANLEVPIALLFGEVGDLTLVFEAVAVAGFGAFGLIERMLVFLVAAIVLGAAEFAHCELVIADCGGVLLFEFGEFGAFVVEDDGVQVGQLGEVVDFSFLVRDGGGNAVYVGLGFFHLGLGFQE
jgi:hypothetical protein